MTTSRKHNPFLPTTVIFVETRQGMEYIAKDYSPQRWIKSIKKDGSLTYTRDPRVARRFKNKEQVNELCSKYANNAVIALHSDQLRFTGDSNHAMTYFGYYNETNDTNYDLMSSQPVQPPASYLRMKEIMGDN